jgi:uncharacterized protein (DUF58 family)
MRPGSKRLLLLSGLIYGLLFLGLATLNGKILAMALLYRPKETQLRISRTLSTDRAYEESPVAVTLSITNEGSHLEQVLVQDLVPESLEILSGEAEVLASLPAGGTIELNYTAAGSRGSHDFRAIQVTAGEHLGLIGWRAMVSASAHLAIMPRPLRLRRLAIRPLRTRGAAGPIPARLGGSGTDFFGVREYQLGDPRRWINWRVSARHSEMLFTNEFERERIADVGLILDARQRTDIRLGGDSLFEHAVRATASLAETFLSEGNRVGLLIYGGLLNWTLPGYGKVQRERILQALARAETGQSLIFEHLDFLPTRLFPAKSQVVLVSPLCTDDLTMLIRLRARGYQLLVIRPDAVAFELHALEPRPAVAMATRIVQVERRLLRSRLQQAGILVVDWPVDTPFHQVVHAALARMPRGTYTLNLEQIR